MDVLLLEGVGIPEGPAAAHGRARRGDGARGAHHRV